MQLQLNPCPHIQTRWRLRSVLFSIALLCLVVLCRCTVENAMYVAILCILLFA